MSSVRFAGVSKRFGAVEALVDLNLDIASGEFVSLLGPSGSGKSTSLNLLAGLQPIDAGEIFIGDKRVNDLPPDRRDLAMVFQNYALYPHMTVFENVAFPLRARGRKFSEANIESKVAQVAATLGIKDLLARYPKELSGGQQQRVALGRAMVRDPKVFLLDEPLSNLDARLRIRMRKDIKALHDALQSTIVYVTHDQSEAMTISSRIAVFDRGHLQQYGTPEEVYNRPANLFVANFVGEREINQVSGAIEAHAGGFRFAGGGFAIPLDDDVAGGVRALSGRAVTLAVRAEGIVPTIESGDVAGEVVQTELSGPDQIIYVRAGDSVELCCRADPAAHLRKGQLVRLRFITERLHFFDPTTSRTLPAA
ncbi:MAG: ABC transporter ATP-binding protein [Betaproteobacteria bacterium]|nr:ABC transporter ATP-binding protein [Betaproteobacteria bacterium]